MDDLHELPPYIDYRDPQDAARYEKKLREATGPGFVFAKLAKELEETLTATSTRPSLYSVKAGTFDAAI
jgi:hypothetical protein